MGGLSPSLCGTCNVNVSELNNDVKRHEKLIEMLREEIKVIRNEIRDENSEILEKIGELRLRDSEFRAELKLNNVSLCSDIKHIKDMILSYGASSYDLKSIK